ncbi:FAD/NAD(P)-binding domain-containing protein [Aaosphaeria arxii CBS 175.79]|uniref:FAD/NAD(P)-binding domain-containing protein n=1 Tax=Aaosphaeria arxii CBS 175.79 TaxID=1450172 RepID=A0A6A5Y1F6_9PLEO|nr:FAD/NAD(P)-binding domain-containing protein [Aaosphaeria arxii CBS 175.79]KAF2018650.1 FAD/NAD(P)-binding domain-containing protein [Aaosphaeria arxii CBS 175.79]
MAAAALRPQIVDGLIIGGGPAGLNCALTFARLQSTAIVFDSSTYRNEGVKHMHTVATRDHFDPQEFRRIARDQIESRYKSVWFEKAIITHAAKKLIGPDGKYEGFQIKDDQGRTFEGKKLILATGSKDVLPNIPGYKDNWPSHIYQCLACDGYEQRGTPIGVLDLQPWTSHFVHMAQQLDDRVTVFTNGPIPATLPPPIERSLKISKVFGAKFDERKIIRMVNNGPSYVEGITLEFELGEPVTLGFVVDKPPVVNRAQDLIDQLGLETVPLEQGGHLKVNSMNETNVRGVFAAGDTTVMMKQVVIAMADGLKAAAGAGMQIAEERTKEALKTFENGSE